MASTTKKHRDFVAEPMGDKSVTALPGVAEVLGARLQTAGFGMAYNVLGQFLALDKNEQHFKRWMIETCRANDRQSGQCYQCLNQWCNRFF